MRRFAKGKTRTSNSSTECYMESYVTNKTGTAVMLLAKGDADLGEKCPLIFLGSTSLHLGNTLSEEASEIPLAQPRAIPRSRRYSPATTRQEVNDSQARAFLTTERPRISRMSSNTAFIEPSIANSASVSSCSGTVFSENPPGDASSI